MTELRLDYETYSPVDLKKYGLDKYSAHPETEVILAAWKVDDGPIKQWDVYDFEPFPEELRRLLLDPNVKKIAFNAQFERVITRRVLKIKTPYEGWRCTYCAALQQGFVGNLEQIGERIGQKPDKQKGKTGRQLIELFTMPQKITKLNTARRHNPITLPDRWQEFKEYNVQDVVAEEDQARRFTRYPVPESEWELYELDQRINDRGVPIDMQLVTSAINMATLRKAELAAELRELTGLDNPNSVGQLKDWLIDEGYPYNDLQKNTIKKVLTEHAEGTTEWSITPAGIAGLKLRQNAARTSIQKYTALKNCVGADNRMRFLYQYGGASRTLRWAGRRFQQHNLPRTPKMLQHSKLNGDIMLDTATDIIRSGDYGLLKLFDKEPLDLLAGCIRSAIRCDDDKRMPIADLSAIESVVLAWVTDCKRLLKVFADGRDPYKDFCMSMYNCTYDEVTSQQRQDMKPAVLGCGYRLGGGELEDGKRTGLWGYAESMGVNLTRDVSHQAVKTYRGLYAEVKDSWYAIEDAAIRCVKTGIAQRWSHITFEMRKPYLCMILPGGRRLFYYLPRLQRVKQRWTDEAGNPVYKTALTYMGKQQNGSNWVRLQTHGGKLIENLVQAVARDVLKMGLLAAHREGFNIIGHVHDEIIPEQRKGDNRYTHEFLVEVMTRPIDFLPGLPLKAAGYTAQYYRKD